MHERKSGVDAHLCCLSNRHSANTQACLCSVEDDRAVIEAARLRIRGAAEAAGRQVSAIILTTCKLLRMLVTRRLRAKFCLRFPTASTRKSRRPQFLHNGERFLCCGLQQSDGKCDQRNVRVLDGPRDCGRVSGHRQFTRVNCRGELPETRTARLVARRCGLLPLVALRSRRQAAGQPQGCGFGITQWRIGSRLRQSAALA